MPLPPPEARAAQWLSLAGLPGIGPVRAWRLLEQVEDDINALLAMPDAALREWGLNSQQLQALRRPLAEQSDGISWCQTEDCHLLTPDHPDYPALLRTIPAAPLLLWCRGQPARLSDSQLAMVGTRHPTYAGRDNARQLASDLAATGLTITSGLALGIDAICHQAVLDGGGQTVAVLGSGLDMVYPARNKGLAEQILARGGALVSECFPAQGPLPEHFPRRNRIISGLSLGVVVVEAAEQSGSLITARFALEQGRDVFAVPGARQNAQALGCNKLIQQGAKLVLEAADIVEELGWSSGCHSSVATMDGEVSCRLPLPGLLDNVGYEATSVDVVAARAGLPVDVVLGQLVELELEGLVEAVAGGYVRRGG